MREMSVSEQRYKAVLAVIADGRSVTEVAKDWGVSRQTMHGWLARYEQEGPREGGAEALFPSSANANGVSMERRCTATEDTSDPLRGRNCIL